MTISEKELHFVSTSDGTKRYKYFLNKVADRGCAWGLFDTGWVTGGTDSDPWFPLWPTQEYAAVCISNEWNNCVPKKITTDEILNWLLPRLRETNTQLCILLVPGKDGVIPKLDLFESDLRFELSRIE